SRGITRRIVVSPRRFRTVHTTGRKPAGTSVVRSIRHAAGKEIDDRRLRLSVAVKPVIRNHSSRKNDADPQHEREGAGNPGRFWRYPVQIPRRHPAINARMKNPQLQAYQYEHNHFGPEENILIGPQRYGGKHQSSADDHDDETNCGPG